MAVDESVTNLGLYDDDGAFANYLEWEAAQDSNTVDLYQGLDGWKYPATLSPERSALDHIDFCLQPLLDDYDNCNPDDEVCPGLTYSELGGALMFLRAHSVMERYAANDCVLQSN